MTELLAPLRPALHELVRVDRSKITAVTAFQNASGTAVPLAVGAATGYLVPGLAASIGALNVSFSDLPGPYRLRAGRMLVVSLVGTDATLEALSAALRRASDCVGPLGRATGEPADLPADQNTLVQTCASSGRASAPLLVQTERITNSLNTMVDLVRRGC